MCKIIWGAMRDPGPDLQNFAKLSIHYLIESMASQSHELQISQRVLQTMVKIEHVGVPRYRLQPLEDDDHHIMEIGFARFQAT